jgi:hypothetical protein
MRWLDRVFGIEDANRSLSYAIIGTSVALILVAVIR